MIAFGLVFVIGLFVFLKNDGIKSEISENVEISVNGKRLELEFARTAFQITQGLSDRSSMPTGHGMLFVFEWPGIEMFWMNRMRFPLDIVWMRGGTVVDRATLPAPADGEDPAAYTPSVAADRVLELNAGEADGYGLRAGVYVDALEAVW